DRALPRVRLPRGEAVQRRAVRAPLVREARHRAVNDEAPLRGLRGSRPVSRILSRVTIHLCSYPVPRRAASSEPVRLAPDGVWQAAASPRSLVGSYPTVSPLPAAPPEITPSAVCFLCHCPSAFAASRKRASCPAVSGLSSNARARPRSPGLQAQLYGRLGRVAASVERHGAFGAAHLRPVVEHELAAHRALERGSAEDREELLLERPVQRRDA